MRTQRHTITVTVRCDACDQSSPVQQTVKRESQAAALDELRKNGWIIAEKDEVDICSGCASRIRNAQHDPIVEVTP